MTLSTERQPRAGADCLGDFLVCGDVGIRADVEMSGEPGAGCYRWAEELRLEIGDRLEHQVGAIAELPKRTVAVEAEQTTDASIRVIMVHVLRFGGLANSADAVLLSKHLVEVFDGDPVPTPQVIVPRTTVQVAIFPTDPVVAGLAITAEARLLGLVPRIGIECLNFVTFRTPFHPRRNVPWCRSNRGWAKRL